MTKSIPVFHPQYCRPTGLVVAGFSSGVFDLVRMPGFEKVHSLSISREEITTVKFNTAGLCLYQALFSYISCVSKPIVEMDTNQSNYCRRVDRPRMQQARPAAGVGVAL